MIFVKETKPIKISGLTSFIVNTDKFSTELLDVIDSLTTSYWFTKFKCWEISSVDLKLFLDSATPIDDITLQLLKDETKELEDFEKPVTDEEIKYLNFEPRQHQIEAFNFTLKNKKWLLLDSMGCGKTLSIIGSAEILKKRGLIDHCFIICGVNSIKENWANEIQKYGNSSYRILGKKIGKHGGVSYVSVAERAKMLREPIEEFFIITNIETLRDDKVITAIQNSKNNFGMIVVDEIHRCATKHSSQGKNLLKLDATYLIGSTGTVITNKPESAYVPLVWTKNDKSILTTFRPQYEIKENDRVVGYKNLDVLQEEISQCSLRRTMDDVRSDLPQKIIEYEILEFNDRHKKFYENILHGVKEEVDKVELTPGNVLALNIRLRQAATCPSILTSEDIVPTKLERCAELIEEIVSQKEKVIVLSFFVEPCNQLAELVKRYNPLVLTGETNEKDSAEIQEKFKTSSKYNVLIGTHGKMGTGLSFAECRYMIILDLPWTSAQFSQSCDRIYRLTSTRDVYIKVLELKNSIDERVRKIVETKADLQSYLVDNDDEAYYRITLKSKSLNTALKEILDEL